MSPRRRIEGPTDGRGRGSGDPIPTLVADPNRPRSEWGQQPRSRLAEDGPARGDQNSRRRHSGPWSLGYGDPEDAALVLPVLRWTIEQGHPRPTENVGNFVVRVRRGFPDLDIGSAYELALAAAAGGAPRDRAETYLAFTPWMDKGAALVRASGVALWAST